MEKEDLCEADVRWSFMLKVLRLVGLVKVLESKVSLLRLLIFSDPFCFGSGGLFNFHFLKICVTSSSISSARINLHICKKLMIMYVATKSYQIFLKMPN